MIIRNDIHGDPQAPSAYTEFLGRVGGKNPYGENNYRLVHTSNRMQLQGGAWKEWAENLTTQERGGFKKDPDTGLLVPAAQPIRTVIEMRHVHKYVNGFEGWLLERWMPASFYGSREVWNHLHLPNHPDILLLGPYPENGDYECCSSIEAEMPSLAKLQEAIQYQTFVQENVLRGDLESMTLDRVERAAKAYEDEMSAAAAENEYRIKDFLSPWTHLSLGTGRWRQQMADRAGVKEHAGN